VPEPPRLLDRVRDAIRVRHYSIRTEDAYVGWAKRFILFHHKKHPSAMGAGEVNAFLTHLATEGNVSASTQAQALSALLFLYKHVLEDPLPWLDDIVRARRTRRLPAVLTRQEVRSLLGAMSGTPRLVACVLYGGGLRLLEALRLRVKDIDFAANLLIVREGKGEKDRRTMLPENLRQPSSGIRAATAPVRAVSPGREPRGSQPAPLSCSRSPTSMWSLPCPRS
jgi:integrase